MYKKKKGKVVKIFSGFHHINITQIHHSIELDFFNFTVIQ